MKVKIFTVLCLILALAILPFPTACAKSAPASAPASATTSASTPASPAAAAAPTTASASPKVSTPATAPASAVKSIRLKTVTFAPTNQPDVAQFKIWIDKVNERAKGELIIDLLGGPEVVPVNSQGAAVKDGVVDIAWVFSSSYASIVREGTFLGLSMLEAKEERSRGVWDIMRDAHAKQGIFWLGRGDKKPPFDLYRIATNKRADTPSQLVGQKLAMRFGPIQFMKKLGITTIMIDDAEMYSALERGVVDAVARTFDEFVGRALQERTKYMIDHTFYGTSTSIIINMGTWNRIPKNLQDLMQQVQLEVEPIWGEMYLKRGDEFRQIILKAGVEFIHFSPKDAEWFAKTCYEAEMDGLTEKWPDIGPAYKKLLAK